jgi:type II secretory pathway pseudopilin PulG
MKSFTLIETLVVIAIFAISLGAIFGSILMLYRSHGYSWEQSQAIEEARRGIEIMTKEIREAREGEDGSYPIVLAGDKEFIFFSDIDNDGKTERVRYFLGTTNSGSQTKKCVTFSTGGSCSVDFSNFLQGNLKSAQVKVSVEGDLGNANEYVEIFADGQKLGNLCQSGCTDCAGTWQGTTTFDVTSLASDNSITFLANATSQVNQNCSWEEPNHKMKAQFEFSWTEEIIGGGSELKKGVIEPIGDPPQYPLDQEKLTVITSYVRNTPPIFEYYDKDGNKIEPLPARLSETKMMKVFLVINVNPNKPPENFQLESYVQLRNLKE